MSAPDGFLAGAATGAAPGTARTVMPARSGPSNSCFASDFSRDTPFPDGGGLSAPGHVDGTSPLLRSGGFRPKSGSWQKNRHLGKRLECRFGRGFRLVLLPDAVV